MSEAKYKVGDRLVINGPHKSSRKGKVFTVVEVMCEPGLHPNSPARHWYRAAEPFAVGGVWEDHVGGYAPTANDPVNHPVHYNADPSGVECIEVVRHRNFNIGNAFKYLWRNGLKDSVGKSAREKQVEDLRKAIFYIEDEIQRLEVL